jgi:hypothetical protein
MANKAKTIEQKLFDTVSDEKKKLMDDGYDHAQYERLNYFEQLIVKEMQTPPPPQQKKPLTGIEALLSGQQEDIDGVTGNGSGE